MKDWHVFLIVAAIFAGTPYPGWAIGFGCFTIIAFLLEPSK